MARIAESYAPAVAKSSDRGFPQTLEHMEGAGFAQLGRLYIEAVRSLCSAEYLRIVDKMPFNFIHVGFIKLILPRCRIVHCKRNAMATGVSVFKSYFTSDVDFAWDLEEIGRYYHLYEELMEHWEQVFPDSIHTVRLEDMVGDQVGETRKLYDFVGLPWDDRALRFYEVERPVRTASALQVRRPIYRSSLDSWRRHESHLEPLFRALGPSGQQRVGRPSGRLGWPSLVFRTQVFCSV